MKIHLSLYFSSFSDLLVNNEQQREQQKVFHQIRQLAGRGAVQDGEVPGRAHQEGDPPEQLLHGQVAGGQGVFGVAVGSVREGLPETGRTGADSVPSGSTFGLRVSRHHAG